MQQVHWLQPLVVKVKNCKVGFKSLRCSCIKIQTNTLLKIIFEPVISKQTLNWAPIIKQYIVDSSKWNYKYSLCNFREKTTTTKQLKIVFIRCWRFWASVSARWPTRKATTFCPTTSGSSREMASAMKLSERSLKIWRNTNGALRTLRLEAVGHFYRGWTETHRNVPTSAAMLSVMGKR